MGTERFEDKIKRQLRDREITPSAGSWDKLSARLDETQQKKKPFVLWMGIAASIIGGILILSLVFNNSIPSNSPEMVDVPKEEVKLEENPVETSENIFNKTQEKEEQVAVSETETETETETEIINSQPKVIVDPVKQIQIKSRKELAVIENTNLMKDPKLLVDTVNTNKEELDAKIMDALESIVLQIKNEQSYTSVEANKLLAEAASKINQEQYISNFREGEINAQNLLQDVELEMDNSFRDKILELLKEGYSKAKTAVANKNYL